MADDSTWHWSIRIKEYLEADWSKRPTPFAQTVVQYFQSNCQVLELGCGAGQDSIWFAQNGHKVVCADQTDVAFGDIQARAQEAGVQIALQTVDLLKPFPFADESFDAVYAQLVIHYFNNADTQAIYDEIHRVLKPGGVVAVMVNTMKDAEYDPSKLDSDGLLHHKGLTKRYFSKETLAPFVTKFEPVLFDEDGRTPKDDAKDNAGMVRFVGRKP